MTLNQYEKAHIALLAQIAKATERIADAIETFNATDPLQAIEKALEYDLTAMTTTSGKASTDRDPVNVTDSYGAQLPEDEKWRAR
jgi:hypothetical protein